MYLRRAFSSAALAMAVASACSHPDAGDDGAVLTVAEATNAMLVSDELPGEWRATDVSERRAGSVFDPATSASDCGQATHKLAEEASRWGAADVNVEAAWETPDGDIRLKQEIASDRNLEAGRLAGLLSRQATACRTVVVVVDDVTVESRLRSCGLRSGEPGVEILQSWTASDGRSGSTRFAYIFRGRNLVVLTLMSSDAGNSCQHADFDRVVAAAASKVAR